MRSGKADLATVLKEFSVGNLKEILETASLNSKDFPSCNDSGLGNSLENFGIF